VGRLFNRVIRATGLPHFHLYDLRQTFVSHLIASGATVDYVSTMLGHASITMTLTVAPGGINAGYHTARRPIARRPASRPPSR
jgi:integrase